MEAHRILQIKKPVALYDNFLQSARQSSNRLLIPRGKIIQYSNNNLYSAPRIWNHFIEHLPIDVSTSSLAFKSTVKRHLLELQKKGRSEEWEPYNLSPLVASQYTVVE